MKVCGVFSEKMRLNIFFYGRFLNGKIQKESEVDTLHSLVVHS